MESRLSDHNIELISNNVVEKLIAKLPPLMCTMMKEIMPGAINHYEEERENSTRIRKVAKKFMDQNPHVFNKELKARREK